MKALENRIPPPLVMIVIALAMGAAALRVPQILLPDDLRWGLTGACVLLAGLFGPPAIASFGRAATTIDPVRIGRASALVTTGVYRFSRNPMYVAMAMLLCALAMALDRPLTLAGPLAYVLYITRFQIIPEERMLFQKFGEDYQQYRNRTRRWL